MSKMNELEPCPFCDGKADVSLRNMIDYNRTFLCKAFCTECGASIKYQYTVPHYIKGKPELDALRFITKKWNRRAK